MRYVSLILIGLGLLISSSGFAESVFDNATVRRCPAFDGTLTVCAVVVTPQFPQGANFPLTVNVNNQLFIPYFLNGQRRADAAPNSVARQVGELYQRIFQANRPNNPSDPDAFRDESHRQTASKVVNELVRKGILAGGAPPDFLKDAAVARCMYRPRPQDPEVRTLCARVNNNYYLISTGKDQNGKSVLQVTLRDGRIVRAPKELSDNTLRFYQKLFDKHFNGQSFDPNKDDAFRDQAHFDLAKTVAKDLTGIEPGRGVTFAPPSANAPTDGNGGGSGGGHDGGGSNSGTQRPPLEQTKSVFEQREERFSPSGNTRKPEVEALKKAISDTGKGGLTFVAQQCVYKGNSTLYDRTLALGMKSDGTLFAQILPKEQEGKVSLDKLEAGGIKLEDSNLTPPSLRGTRRSSEMGATSRTELAVRQYEEGGKTKYLIRMTQESGKNDPNPVVAYCAAKSNTEVGPVSWKDETKPVSARIANLFSDVCAKCHGPSSSRKVKFNADGTIALQAGQTPASVRAMIAARVASTSATSPQMMPPPDKISETDRVKLRQLVKDW